jgi:Pentapeptide repeats (8 copies)
MVRVVQRFRELATATFALFAGGAAIAQVADAGIGLRYGFAAVALSGALVALGLWWLEREAAWNEEADARFSRALAMLGDFGARQGGIYQMEAIAKSAPRQYATTMLEVLTAYVRERAPWPPIEDHETAPDANKRRPPPDVQAAIEVLGRRNPEHDGDLVLRLSDVNLRGASLRGGEFDRARLRRAHLENAKLEGAKLRGAELRKAHLERADLAPDSDLHLPGADLTEADLTGASLNGADLRGANFTNATLDHADLGGAIYDAATSWPTGFDFKGATNRP